MLHYFNFGHKIINWIKLLHHDFEVCTINAGHFSNFFKIERSVHQGCLISLILFVLCTQVLNSTLKNTEDIKPVLIDKNRNLIGQFADDTDLTLTYDQHSLLKSLKHWNILKDKLGWKSITIKQQYTVRARYLKPMRNCTHKSNFIGWMDQWNSRRAACLPRRAPNKGGVDQYRVGGSCRGGLGHTYIWWVTKGWGGSCWGGWCGDGVGHAGMGGVGHAGVGSGGRYRGGMGWVMKNIKILNYWYYSVSNPEN